MFSDTDNELPLIMLIREAIQQMIQEHMTTSIQDHPFNYFAVKKFKTTHHQLRI